LQLDFSARELTVKLVYYGPALSGKTTNLQALHAATDPSATGRLMTLETKDDRTLFFDLLPLTFKGKGDLSVRIKVFTVPGQVIHASTRRLVAQYFHADFLRGHSGGEHEGPGGTSKVLPLGRRIGQRRPINLQV
jgi:hypothetical protein